MKKPWSITTTTRSPYRLRAQLSILKKQFMGIEWTKESQVDFQITLIQNRLYGYNEEKGFSAQFLKGLTEKQKQIFTDFSHSLTMDEARDIFDTKNYKDPPMRGRLTFNPFKKFGFVRLRNKKLELTLFGEGFLSSNYDLADIFFKAFIRWQIPNPDNDDYKVDDGYNIKPFIGTLHLINIVNQKAIAAGEDSKGISKQEFLLFVPTLINYKDIKKHAEDIIKLRMQLKGKNKKQQKTTFEDFKEKFAKQFLRTTDKTKIKKLLQNLKDYGDNAIRYFRLTKYFYIRGGGFYVDLEQRRQVEIENLLAFDNGKALSFATQEEYLDYIANITGPKLPWETKEKLGKILDELIKDIRIYENKLSISKKVIENYKKLNEDGLRKLIESFREYRRYLQEQENHSISQNTEAILSYIRILKNIYKEQDKPIVLEKYAALALHALNDALRIQPNYPVGDDNEPTFTAPAGKPDIECYYASFNAICEVTMLTGRDQWYNEGQPIMRHLRDFEERNKEKSAYCIFVAPALHRDTLNTFWVSVKYEYEGKQQKIIPLSIQSFIELLKTLVEIKQKGRFFSHSELSRLYDEILFNSKGATDVNEWMGKIPGTISSWKESLVV